MRSLFIFLFISFFLNNATTAQDKINAQICFSHCPDSQREATLILETNSGNALTFFSDSLIFNISIPKVNYFIKLIRKGHKTFHSKLRLSDIDIAENETISQWFSLAYDSVTNESMVITDSNYCNWKVSYTVTYNGTLIGGSPTMKLETSDYLLEWMGYCNPQASILNVFDETYLNCLKNEIDFFFQANNRTFTKRATKIISRDTNNASHFNFNFSTVDSAFFAYEQIRIFMEEKKKIKSTPCNTIGYHLAGVGSCYKFKNIDANLYYGFTTQEKITNKRLSKIPKAERYFLRMDMVRKRHNVPKVLE